MMHGFSIGRGCSVGSVSASYTGGPQDRPLQLVHSFVETFFLLPPIQEEQVVSYWPNYWHNCLGGLPSNSVVWHLTSSLFPRC